MGTTNAEGAPARLALPRLARVRPAVAGFLALYLLSCLLYSGGHVADPQATHYSAAWNFLCDQFLTVNFYNGRPNGPSAACAILAGVLLVFGALLPVWQEAPGRLLPGHAAARRLAWLAPVATVAMLAIPLEGLLDTGLPHYAVLLFAAVPALAVTGGVVVLSLRAPGAPPRLRWIAVALLAGIAACLIAYLPGAIAGRSTAPVLALAQKPVMALALAWLWTIPGALPPERDPAAPGAA